MEDQYRVYERGATCGAARVAVCLASLSLAALASAQDRVGATPTALSKFLAPANERAHSARPPERWVAIDEAPPERLAATVEALAARHRPAPRERPFTGPWMGLERAPLPSTLRQEAADAAGEPGHWSGLPMLAELATDRGIRLPEPLGLSVTYASIERPSNVDAVRAGVNGGPLQELPSLNFQADAHVEMLIGRFDAWVLPMLNVYFLGGYVWNQSRVELTVDVPGAPGTPIVSDGDLEGPLYGVGTTLVGGYGNYFLLLDYNVSRVELGELSQMDARLLTGRVGYRSSDFPWADEARFYLATTYWDTARTIGGTIPGGGGAISSIEFEVDQSPVDPLTVGAGTNIEFGPHWGLVFEMQGYQDTLYVVGALNVRF